MRLKNHHSKGRTVPLMGKGGKLVDVFTYVYLPSHAAMQQSASKSFANIFSDCLR
jgi:hypothetical protein